MHPSSVGGAHSRDWIWSSLSGMVRFPELLGAIQAAERNWSTQQSLVCFLPWQLECHAMIRVRWSCLWKASCCVYVVGGSYCVIKIKPQHWR